MNLPSEADLIVVGSGVAGLTAALEGAGRGARVLLVTASELVSGSSWWAQGGIAAAIGPDDRVAYHVADTMAVGASLNDRRAVHVLVEEGKRAATQLVESGVPFEEGPQGPALGLEAGHGHRRILHAGGGATGEAVSSALLRRVTKHSQITTLPNTPVDRLLSEGGRVVGIASRDRAYRAKAVVLATGGYAGLWARSTNPPGNRGSGLYLAWMAGASLADLEFVQFHPTALAVPGAPAFLLSEALRGEGALLIDSEGHQIINPLLARDVVARGIFRHLQSKGPVYLSMRHLDPGTVLGHFPAIAGQLRAWGLDLARDLIPVAPAAHYCMGGIRSDTAGRTDLPGLYVAGEAACTGAQGANRLASNSLLECLVFGRRAAVASLADRPDRRVRWHAGTLPDDVRLSDQSAAHPSEMLTPETLGPRLDSQLGVERDAAQLEALIADLPATDQCCAPDCLVAGLAGRAALLRDESRGAHYRLDAPASRPEWRGRIIWKRDAPPQFEVVGATGGA